MMAELGQKKEEEQGGDGGASKAGADGAKTEAGSDGAGAKEEGGKTQGQTKQQQEGMINKDEALLALMERTNYNIVQENGQRRYGGPPPDWNGSIPPKGCEVFVGKIPRDCFEDELVPHFETIGSIYELRLMMDFSGANRGYAFVMYTNADDATKAIKKLNDVEIRPGRRLGVVRSVDNCRLFVGGIPRSKREEEVMEEMSRLTEGVVRCIVYMLPGDKNMNRGFAFVEYDSHRAAAMARRKLIPGKIELWGHQIAVDWAEPEPDVDAETMATVTVLYVRNLMLTTTEETLKEAFEAICEPGSVEKVKKVRDFAFVHFFSRQRAEEALEKMDGANLDGVSIEVAWAKPVDKYTYRAQKVMSRSVYYTPQLNAPFGHTTYVGLNPNAVPWQNGFVQRSSSASPTRRSTRGAAGLRGGRGITANLGRLNLNKPHSEIRMFDLHPGMELIPVNPITLRPTKSAVQALQELCNKNNWGDPVYELHSTYQRDHSGSDNNLHLFLYKVTLPRCMSPFNVFQPTKLCSQVEAAKNYAAQHTLTQLGVTEGTGATPPGSPMELCVSGSFVVPPQGFSSPIHSNSLVPSEPSSPDSGISLASASANGMKQRSVLITTEDVPNPPAKEKRFQKKNWKGRELQKREVPPRFQNQPTLGYHPVTCPPPLPFNVGPAYYNSPQQAYMYNPHTNSIILVPGAIPIDQTYYQGAAAYQVPPPHQGTLY